MAGCALQFCVVALQGIPCSRMIKSALIGKRYGVPIVRTVAVVARGTTFPLMCVCMARAALVVLNVTVLCVLLSIRINGNRMTGYAGNTGVAACQGVRGA